MFLPKMEKQKLYNEALCASSSDLSQGVHLSQTNFRMIKMMIIMIIMSLSSRKKKCSRNVYFLILFPKG